MSDSPLSNEEVWQEGRDLGEQIIGDETAEPRSKNQDDYLAQADNGAVEPRRTAANVADVTTSDIAGGTEDNIQDDTGGGGAYDPGTETIEGVKEYVGNHPDERSAILSAEAAGKNRSTLIDWLSAV